MIRPALKSHTRNGVVLNLRSCTAAFLLLVLMGGCQSSKAPPPQPAQAATLKLPADIVGRWRFDPDSDLDESVKTLVSDLNPSRMAKRDALRAKAIARQVYLTTRFEFTEDGRLIQVMRDGDTDKAAYRNESVFTVTDLAGGAATIQLKSKTNGEVSIIVVSRNDDLLRISRPGQPADEDHIMVPAPPEGAEAARHQWSHIRALKGRFSLVRSGLAIYSSDPKVVGACTPAAVLEGLTYSRMHMAMCHAKSRSKGPASGVMHLSFGIGADGKPIDLKAVRSSFADPEFEACVTTALKRRALPKTGPGDCQIEVPIEFAVKTGQ